MLRKLATNKTRINFKYFLAKMTSVSSFFQPELITGLQLRLLGHKYCKVLNPEWNHYGYRWHVGENVDPLPWNPSGECQLGGLYFTTSDKVHKHAYDPFDENWIGEVTVDDDEPVWQEEGKWKAHRVTLSNVVKVDTLPDEEYYRFIRDCYSEYVIFNSSDTSDQVWYKLMDEYPSAMSYVRPNEWRVCFDYVGLTKRPEEYDLQDFDDKQCIRRAIRHNPWIIKFLPRIDSELAFTAVNKIGRTIKYVAPELQTEELCSLAVMEDGALRYVKNQTEKICMESIRHHVMSFRLVRNKTRAIILQALDDNPAMLRYVDEEDQTEDICTQAIEDTPRTFVYVKRKTPFLCELAVQRLPLNLEHVPESMQTEKMCREAVQSTKLALPFVAPRFRHLFTKYDQ